MSMFVKSSSNQLIQTLMSTPLNSLSIWTFMLKNRQDTRLAEHRASRDGGTPSDGPFQTRDKHTRRYTDNAPNHAFVRTLFEESNKKREVVRLLEAAAPFWAGGGVHRRRRPSKSARRDAGDPAALRGRGGGGRDDRKPTVACAGAPGGACPGTRGL